MAQRKASICPVPFLPIHSHCSPTLKSPPSVLAAPLLAPLIWGNFWLFKKSIEESSQTKGLVLTGGTAFRQRPREVTLRPLSSPQWTTTSLMINCLLCHPWWLLIATNQAMEVKPLWMTVSLQNESHFDLYLYFYFRSLFPMRTDGRHCQSYSLNQSKHLRNTSHARRQLQRKFQQPWHAHQLVFLVYIFRPPRKCTF